MKIEKIKNALEQRVREVAFDMMRDNYCAFPELSIEERRKTLQEDLKGMGGTLQIIWEIKSYSDFFQAYQNEEFCMIGLIPWEGEEYAIEEFFQEICKK